MAIEPLRRGGEVLARDRAAPRIRARASVAEDAPREHEPGLAFRPELRERRDLLVVEEAVRDVELGLDVRLAALGPDGGCVGSCAEDEPDRLSEDRLPGPGLAGHRVEARRKLEVGLTDEDEVLDPQPTKQSSAGSA